MNYSNGYNSIEAILESSKNDNYNSDVIDVNASGILFQSDLHRDYASLDKGLEYSLKNNKVYAFTGDMINDSNFEEYANAIGYVSPGDVFTDYLSKNLSETDFTSFSTYQQLNQIGGLENYISQISKNTELSKDEIQTEKNRLETIIGRTQNETFVKRINNYGEKFQTENAELLSQLQIGREELYLEMVDIQAKEVAEVFNKYENVKKVVLKGNHENKVFWDLVSNYLTNKEQLIQIDKVGVVKVKDENGYSTTIGGLTNCPFTPNVVNNLNPNLAGYLYSHLNENSPDKNYNRIMNSKEDLDILMSHGQIGNTKLANGKQGINAGQDPSAIVLSQEVKKNKGLIVEGHLHKTTEFTNSYGVNTIRSIGNEVYDVFKNKQGNLEKKLIKLDAEYNGDHEDLIGYDYEVLSKRVNERLKNRLKIMRELEEKQTNVA